MSAAALAASVLLLPLSAQEPASAQDAAPAATRGALVETLGGELECGTGGLEVDAEGFVYCSDFGFALGGRGGGGTNVFKIHPETGVAEVFATGFRGASGNAIGPEGFFYQSNIGGNFISRVSPDGTSEVFLAGDLSSPVGIAIDSEGVLFVANCGSASITAVTPDGVAEVFASDPLLSCPNGIALDDEHNLYVANFNNGDLVRVSWNGEVEKFATIPGNNNGHLVYHDGVFYVAARGAHSIYRVSARGKVELFAGTGRRGHDDGPRLEASFTFPNDLAVSPDGKYLYVNEPATTDEPHTVLAPTLVRRIQLDP